MTGASSYSWIFEDGLDVATCVTVVADARSDEVLGRFGADTTRVLDPERDDEAYGGSVAATDVAGGVVAVETNGFQGSLEPVLLRVAAGGTAASVFWNVNGDNSFVLVRHGAVVVDVDLYDAEDDDDASDSTIPPELQGLWSQIGSDDDPEPWAAGLAMAAAATGVAIPREAVAAPARRHPLPQEA